MEERRVLLAIGPARADLGALQGQDRSDVARHLGGLGAVDGDHLLAALPVAVSTLQHRADLLGAAADLHDESLRGEDRGGRADCALGHTRLIARWTNARKLSSCAPKDEIARDFSTHAAAAGRADFHFSPEGTEAGLQGGDSRPGQSAESAPGFYRAETADRAPSLDASGARPRSERSAREPSFARVAGRRTQGNALRFSRRARNQARGRWDGGGDSGRAAEGKNRERGGATSGEISGDRRGGVSPRVPRYGRRGAVAGA